MSATLKTTGTRVLEGAAAAKKQVRDVFAKYDSGEGTISQEALADVLAELDGKRPTTHQILFALKSMEVPPEGVITLKELSEYWQRVQAGHAGGRLNKLLVKDKVSDRTMSVS